MAPLVVDIFFFFFSFYFFFFFLFFCLSYTDILEFLYPSQFTVLLRLFFFSLLAAFFDLLSTLWWRRVHIRRIKMIREFSRSNLIEFNLLDLSANCVWFRWSSRSAEIVDFCMIYHWRNFLKLINNTLINLENPMRNKWESLNVNW